MYVYRLQINWEIYKKKILSVYLLFSGASDTIVLKALCYRSRVRGFEGLRPVEINEFFLFKFSGRIRPLILFSLLKEMSTGSKK
jgi:hypothetical protein